MPCCYFFLPLKHAKLKCNGLRFVQTHKRNGDEIYKHYTVSFELTAQPVPGKREPRSLCKSMDSGYDIQLRFLTTALS